MTIIDSEDIITSLKTYISEDVGGGVSRLNTEINCTNTIKGDSMLPNVSNSPNDIVLSQRIAEIDIKKNGRINLDIIGEAKMNPTFDRVATVYIVEVSYIIRDDFSNNVFLRALRMEGVMKRVMENYLKDTWEAGIMKGEIESSFTPERVLLGNTSFKAIKSGIVYQLTLF